MNTKSLKSLSSANRLEHSLISSIYGIIRKRARILLLTHLMLAVESTGCITAFKQSANTYRESANIP